ncbi:MAG: phosphatase PAP2 family protein [Chitinophagaceae bacterium]|nr:MAG: phosphatase PAP2 family protein [Chitinophagaceae bacterium]
MLLIKLLTIWDNLKIWDQWFFIQVNNNLSNDFFDSVMPLIRNSYFWIPLYIFLILFATINFKTRGWWWVVFFICTVSITDLVSSRLLKEYFERLRPCMDPDFSSNVRLLLNRCSGGFSFTSSHAANHFGIAGFFFITTQFLIKKWAMLGFFWATAICFAQVYVGVHYPLDVLGGAIVGLLVGIPMGLYFKKQF